MLSCCTRSGRQHWASRLGCPRRAYSRFRVFKAASVSQSLCSRKYPGAMTGKFSQPLFILSKKGGDRSIGLFSSSIRLSLSLSPSPSFSSLLSLSFLLSLSPSICLSLPLSPPPPPPPSCRRQTSSPPRSPDGDPFLVTFVVGERSRPRAAAVLPSVTGWNQFLGPGWPYTHPPLILSGLLESFLGGIS